MGTVSVGGGSSVGVNPTGAGSVETNSVGVDSIRVVGVGIGPVEVGTSVGVGMDSVDVGSGVGVDVETDGGRDVIVGRTALSVRDEAVTVRLSPAYRSRLSCNSKRIRMIVRITATINLKRS